MKLIHFPKLAARNYLYLYAYKTNLYIYIYVLNMTQKNANISNTDDLLSTRQLEKTSMSGRFFQASQTYLFAESRHFFIQTMSAISSTVGHPTSTLFQQYKAGGIL